MAEYGVVLAVVALVVFTALTLLSTNIRGAITSVANIIPGS
jgi:Flp pilus assembly pilin Flp